MSGHGAQPVPHHSQANSGASGGARPRRPPDSSTKAGGAGASSLPNDGKSLISSKKSFSEIYKLLYVMKCGWKSVL